MQKSVYSVVLMDEVVAAVDRLAYAEGTSRSNMMNRILAEYTSLATPEQRMQDVFAAVSEMLEHQSILQPMLSASDAMLTLRSALQYKYNPSMRYVVELYPHAGAVFGEVRAGLRTQNPTLLLYLNCFYKLWAKLEAACLPGEAREYSIENGRYTRRLCTPEGEFAAARAGNSIAGYISLFDACLKTFFEQPEHPRVAEAVHHVYTQSLETDIAAL